MRTAVLAVSFVTTHLDALRADIVPVEEALADGRLVQLPVDMAAPTLSPVCAHHKGKWVSPLLQCFLDLVTQTPLL